MRARLILTNDLDGSVLQSLDLPMPPEPVAAVKVPGTDVSLRVEFIRDDLPVASMGHLTDLALAVHANAIDKGFWAASENIGEKLALIHSEVSEALEAYRDTRTDNLRFINWSPITGKPDGFPVELADAIIRIADLAAFLGVNLDEAVRVKHEFNLTRPALHGRRL